jgi:hypothetical protein
MSLTGLRSEILTTDQEVLSLIYNLAVDIFLSDEDDLDDEIEFRILLFHFIHITTHIGIV